MTLLLRKQRAQVGIERWEPSIEKKRIHDDAPKSILPTLRLCESAAPRFWVALSVGMRWRAQVTS